MRNDAGTGSRTLEKGTIIPIFGERIEILVTSAGSNNTLVVAVQTSPPGGGPPPHRHLREEEVFTSTC